MSGASDNNFKNKKVLVFGLGLLGGGVATTNWLIKHGARVTVTDLKSESYLEPSLKRLKGKTELRLNGHDKKDIETNEIIVFNPDVSVNNPFVKYARELGKQIENEATIFYKLCPRPIIAVTGTRGKTTTATWIGYFLNHAKHVAVVTGNSSEQPLLKVLDTFKSDLPNREPLPDYSFQHSQECWNRTKSGVEIVNEIPSYHLEFFDGVVPAPKIAVITNVYRDHLNRYKSFEDYAKTKANIFKNQTSHDCLVLNYDNNWTKFLLKLKPKSQVWFFSTKRLPRDRNGIFVKGNFAYFQFDGESGRSVFRVLEFVERWGRHNLENLLAGALAAYLAGTHFSQIARAIGTSGKKLPQVPFRQEVIYESRRLKIINDTAATSPDGGIAAIERFASPSCILIAGGTDRELDFKQWARIVKSRLKPENVILLAGSATDKMLKELRDKRQETMARETLRECLKEAITRASKYRQSVILFSPAAKSFEKFKNEYDRGKQFNRIVRKFIKIDKGGVA